MKITAIELQNIRGFKNLQRIGLSKKINLFIGPNNAGKSTLLNSVFLLQKPNALVLSDRTIGETNSKVSLIFNGFHNPEIPEHLNYNRVVFNFESVNNRRVFDNSGNNRNFSQTSDYEPSNLIYPYLSKRKTAQYIDQINEKNANSVTGNFSNLYSKIDRLVTPQFQPGNKEYIEACKNILGFEISTLAIGGGKQAVYFVHNLEYIPLTSMGEGVSNILGLVTDLCIAENKIFLIEEPENDIHPKALKALLRLIIQKSETNQIFISTHSNIVMKYLGSASDTKIFNVTNNQRDSARPNLFISSIVEVPDDLESRRLILEDLGYDFFDFDLWKGWLFFEESSAEVLVRDYLIPWFVPGLKGKIRTFSAGSTSSIETKFEDFNRLFVFLHLEPTYKNKVWVIIDDGKEEKEIINRMKDTYVKVGWNDDNFSQFSEHDFERYYPKRYLERVENVLAITDKQEKRISKKQLLDDVKEWILNNEGLAKEEFKESASEVIEKLKKIAKELK